MKVSARGSERRIFTESRNRLGWKGPSRSSSSNPAPWAATLSLDQHYLCELVHCPRPSSHPVAERVFVAFSTWLKPLPSHHQREDRRLTDMGMGESILQRLNLSSWDLTSSLDYTRSIYSTSLICLLLPPKVCDQLRDTPWCGQEV